MDKNYFLISHFAEYVLKFCKKEENMIMEIRFADNTDYREIEKIAIQGQCYHVALRSDIYINSNETNKIISEEQFSILINNKQLIVAVIEDNIKAYMTFEEKVISNPLIIKRKVLFINNLAVDKQFRNFGIANEMMMWVKAYAKKAKYEKIELQVNCSNEIAKKLYYKHGFKDKSLNMEYDI